MFGRRPSRPRRPTSTVRQLFHSVSIQPAEGCRCEAVLGLSNARFLADEAPALPLSGCGTPSGCRCKYRHYDDRRGAPRRETDFGLPRRSHPHDVRRGAGRRITDG